jgi:hypothetical protein
MTIPEIKLLKPFIMWVMENPALRWGISLLAEMGENTMPAGSNSADGNLPFLQDSGVSAREHT